MPTSETYTKNQPTKVLVVLEDPFEECHYQRLSDKGRSNIYSLAIPDYNSTTDNLDQPLPWLSILVALSDGVYLLLGNKDGWLTITESVDSGEEFTSIDAYYPKDNLKSSFLICYAKFNPGLNTYTLNFSKLEILDKGEVNKCIEVVDRFHIQVPWAPLKITHTTCLGNLQGKPSFIVCSSAQSVHAFIQNNETVFEFAEAPLEQIYPELVFLKECDSNILVLNVQTNGNLRNVAAGCQDGTLVFRSMRYNAGKLGRHSFCS